MRCPTSAPAISTGMPRSAGREVEARVDHVAAIVDAKAGAEPHGCHDQVGVADEAQRLSHAGGTAGVTASVWVTKKHDPSQPLR